MLSSSLITNSIQWKFCWVSHFPGQMVSIVLGTVTKSAQEGPNSKYCGFVTYVSSYIANLYMPFEKKDGNLCAHTNWIILTYCSGHIALLCLEMWKSSFYGQIRNYKKQLCGCPVKWNTITCGVIRDIYSFHTFVGVCDIPSFSLQQSFSN